MRLYFLCFGFACCSVSTNAQSKKNISSWFYDLPISKNAKGLKKAIKNNGNFEESLAVPANNLKLSAHTFKGIILQPILPKEGPLDSAKIRLAVGTLNVKDGYSGDMKWLFFEYFSKDTIFLNQLYEIACSDFKSDGTQEKFTGFRTKNLDVVGEGKKYIYINDASELRSVSVERVRYASGVQSFSVHYSESDD